MKFYYSIFRVYKEWITLIPTIDFHLHTGKDQYKNFLTYNNPSENINGVSKQTANRRYNRKKKEGMIETVDGKDYVRLNASELSEHIRRGMNFEGGLYAVKSDEDFSTEKGYIGKQLAEAIGFNQELRKRSAELYAERLDRMETDDYWINEDKFTSRADLKNRFNQAEDKARFLREDRQAIEYIQDQKDALRKKSLTHYMVDGRSATKLAFPLLGSFFQDAILAGKADINKNSDLSWLYEKNLRDRDFLKSSFGLDDKTLDLVSTNGEIDLDKIMFAPESKDVWSIVGRTPAAINTFSRMLNIAASGKTGIKRASAKGLIGGNGDIAMMSPSAIYRMNTGDFDGDTVWMYTHLQEQMAERMFADLEKINKAAVLDNATKAEIDTLLNQQMEELKKKGIADKLGDRVGEEIYNFRSGQSEMGKSSAIMRNALDLYNINTAEGRQKFMKAYNLGSAAYDKATSEGQNMGWTADYFNYMGRASYLAGRQLSRFEKDVAENYTRSNEEKENNSQQSIFKNRMLSLNNMMGLSDALGRARMRQAFGVDFGFGDMADTWLQDTYGESTKGYNKVLFKAAAGWERILKGQYDLSYLRLEKSSKEIYSEKIAFVNITI